MADLIDRAALLKAIDRQYGVTDYRKGEEKELVMKLPAVDAEPVRHGKWVKTEYAPSRYTKCNLCGRRIEIGDKSNYCPHCGARMDGGGDGTES